MIRLHSVCRNIIGTGPRLAWLCAVALCAAPAVAQTQNQPGSPLAVFDGQPIFESQLPSEDQAQLLKMSQQIYGVELRAVHAVVDRKVVEAEARKRGLTVEELFAKEVTSKIADPTDEEVSAYYEARIATNRKPFEEVKDAIRQNLKAIAVQKARTAYIQDLVQQAVVDGSLTLTLSPPKVEIGVDPTRLRGDAKAPVTIVEFSDFSCSFCRGAEEILNQLLEKYKGQVRFSYRDFPLRQMHPQAELAAEASRCAGEQGKYWEYHDLLFANVSKQDHAGLMAHAATLKLNDHDFDQCLTSGRYRSQVDQDTQLGIRSGVVATPGFFVNGRFINGAQPIETFEKAIDEELSNAIRKGSGR